MAKFHHKSLRRQSAQNPQNLFEAVQSFLASSRAPALVDYGDEPIALEQGHYNVEIRSGKLMIEVWNEQRSISRRILSIDRTKPGLIDCTVQRFGGAAGKLTLFDLERPQTSFRAALATRQSFAEQFRRMLQRQLPAWEIRSLSSALDLRRSFSASFPRAHLCRGLDHVAALACPDSDSEPAVLANAILWYDYLRGRLDAKERLALHLFLPEQSGNLTAHRLRWLTARRLGARLFRFSDQGMAGEVDPKDLGNLETKLTSQYTPFEPAAELKTSLSRLMSTPGLVCCPELDGSLSIRFRGCEFARIRGSGIVLGIENREELSISELHKVENFARHLASLAPELRRETELPVFAEKWFEGAIRGNLQMLDADLLADPVHGQVLTFAGGTRELIDLVAISRSGRLTIIELKTSEDIHLPLQGLDYWMRIRWHAERQELGHLFPGGAVAPVSPKLLLVAPAFSFHPTNEIVLRYFSPEISVERIGVNSDWESGLRVVFRLQGAEVPISHQERNDT
ncbi:MAG TPA: hypothetical protein VH477_13735 [Bryobacteraceae bacterium]